MQIQVAYGTANIGAVTRPLSEPFFAQTTALSSGFIVNTLNGENDHSRSKGFADPLFPQTTYQGHMVVRHPFIINDQHSTGVDFRVKSVSDHLPTIPCTHQLKIVNPPFLVENKGQSTVKGIHEAVGALTTRPHVGVVTDDSWNAFIQAYYGGSNVMNHITEPISSATTKDRHALYTFKEPRIEDCYYRMLKPREIKLAMAFNHDYIVLGSSRDQVKQLGNAVTPPAMEWLVQQCIESLS